MKYTACIIVGAILTMGVFVWAGSITIEAGNKKVEMLEQASQY
jgi:hypothetical protein